MTPYDNDPSTWAFIYDQVWKGFDKTIDMIIEEQKMHNPIFFRETFIDYIYKRHNEEIANGNSPASSTAK